jgi:hypothetical protein
VTRGAGRVASIKGGMPSRTAPCAGAPHTLAIESGIGDTHLALQYPSVLDPPAGKATVMRSTVASVLSQEERRDACDGMPGGTQDSLASYTS